MPSAIGQAVEFIDAVDATEKSSECICAETRRVRHTERAKSIIRSWRLPHRHSGIETILLKKKG